MSGERISGDRKSGDRTSGDRTSDDRTYGDRMSGDRTSGDRMSGDRMSSQLYIRFIPNYSKLWAWCNKLPADKHVGDPFLIILSRICIFTPELTVNKKIIVGPVTSALCRTGT